MNNKEIQQDKIIELAIKCNLLYNQEDHKDNPALHRLKSRVINFANEVIKLNKANNSVNNPKT